MSPERTIDACFVEPALRLHLDEPGLRQGVAIFQDEKIQKELNLTDKQKGEIKDIGEDLRKDMQELGFGGRGGGGGKPFDPAAMQENMKKMQGLQNEAMAKATKVLDDKQKGELKNILGEKLELTMEDMMSGFGRGGPGGCGARVEDGRDQILDRRRQPLTSDSSAATPPDPRTSRPRCRAWRRVPRARPPRSDRGCAAHSRPRCPNAP